LIAVRNLTIPEVSPNDAIKVAALGLCIQQALMNRRRNIEVLIDCPATEFQLQHFSGFVVGNGPERGRFHGRDKHRANLPVEAIAQEQNSTIMLLSEQYWG
jgi:hypothetical protein